MSKKGFSLLEVLLVISVLANIFLLTLNSYSKNYQSNRAKLQRENITALMEYSRTLAMSGSNDIEIYFEDNKILLKSGAKQLKQENLGANFTVDNKKLGFTSAGTPKYAGTIYLYYKNKPIAKFVFAPVSGLMRWAKP